MSSLERIAWLAAVLPNLIASFHASAGESAPGWRHTVFVYDMGAAIEGTAQIGNVKVDVDRYDLTEQGPLVAMRVSF